MKKYDYQTQKFTLLRERYAIEGVTTEFSLVDRNDAYSKFKASNNQQLLDLKNVKQASINSDCLILQINHTNADTKPFANTAQQATYKFINMQLRVLDMTRTLDLMLQAREQHDPKNSAFYAAQREKLHQEFHNLDRYNDSTNSDSEIAAAEQIYDATLINIIQTCQLDTGIPKTTAGYSKLLDKYRIMAGFLDPATILQSEYTEDELKLVDISIPVTEKTTAQKQSLIEFQSGTSEAQQEMDQVFLPYMLKDNTNAGAQGRKEVGPTDKNAYVNYQGIQEGEKVYSKTNLRSGSLYYEKGNKEIDASTRTTYAAQNLQQLKQAQQRLISKNENLGEQPKKLVVIHLVTNLGFNQEDKQIAETKKACKANGDSYNNIPVNPWGAILFNKIDPEFAKNITFWDRFKTIFSQQARYDLAAKVAKNAEEAGYEVVFICASGQDRTGFAIVMDALNFAKDKVQKSFRELINIRGKLGHNANITDLKNLGSPGAKSASLPFWGWFTVPGLSKLGLPHFNKEPKVKEAAIKNKNEPNVDLKTLKELQREQHITELTKPHVNHKEYLLKNVPEIQQLLSLYTVLKDRADIENKTAINLALCDRFVTLLEANHDNPTLVKYLAEHPDVITLLEHAEHQKADPGLSEKAKPILNLFKAHGGEAKTQESTKQNLPNALAMHFETSKSAMDHERQSGKVTSRVG